MNLWFMEMTFWQEKGAAKDTPTLAPAWKQTVNNREYPIEANLPVGTPTKAWDLSCGSRTEEITSIWNKIALTASNCNELHPNREILRELLKTIAA